MAAGRGVAVVGGDEEGPVLVGVTTLSIALVKIARPALFVVSGVQSAIAYVDRPGSACSRRVRKSGYLDRFVEPPQLFDVTLCLSGQTPVAIVAQPRPDSVGVF